MEVVKSWKTDKEDYRDRSQSWPSKPFAFSWKDKLTFQVK